MLVKDVMTRGHGATHRNRDQARLHPPHGAAWSGATPGGKSSRSTPMSHVMTRRVVTVQEDANLGDMLDSMDCAGVGQVSVVCNGKVVSTVSSTHILRLLTGLQYAPATPIISDEAIFKNLDALLADAAWATVTSISSSISSSISHEVKHGVNWMSGVVGSESEREALVIAAQAIEGMPAVKADLAVVPRESALSDARALARLHCYSPRRASTLITTSGRILSNRSNNAKPVSGKKYVEEFNGNR